MIRGFVCGAFDLLHAGHLLMLKQCKEKCDFLIVGLQVDPSVDRKYKNKPVESLLERQIRLEACKYVDKVIIYEEDLDLEIILKTYNIRVRFLGSDYKDQLEQIMFKELVPIEFTTWFPPSSTELRRRIKNS